MGWKIGTDWNAKHEAAGSNASENRDRPYAPESDSLVPVSESDVTTSRPVNVVDED